MGPRVATQWRRLRAAAWLSEEVDPQAIIRDAIETAMPSAQEKRIEVRAEVEADVGTVAADSARLQQMIWNAIKFTPEGGRVTVRLASTPTGIEITVSDTGLGVPPDVLPHVFERFHQGTRP